MMFSCSGKRTLVITEVFNKLVESVVGASELRSDRAAPQRGDRKHVDVDTKDADSSGLVEVANEAAVPKEVKLGQSKTQSK